MLATWPEQVPAAFAYAAKQSPVPAIRGRHSTDDVIDTAATQLPAAAGIPRLTTAASATGRLRRPLRDLEHGSFRALPILVGLGLQSAADAYVRGSQLGGQFGAFVPVALVLRSLR